jgi:hypothetical protein
MATPPQTDTSIVSEARQLYRSALMGSIRAAHKNAHAATVKIGQYTVQYEPLPFSGFTSFGINGFVIGKEAFASDSEFKKTLLHELYRLHHSEMTRGGAVDKHLPKIETQAAFQFAERFYTMI